MTPAQREALHWLRSRGGEGAINSFGVLVALRDLGWLETYAHRCVRVVEKETV